MNDLAVPDTLGLDEVLQPLLQRRSLERLNRLQTLLHPPQYSSRLRRRAVALLECCLVFMYWLGRPQPLPPPPRYSTPPRRREKALLEGCLVIHPVLVSKKEITWF